MGPVKPGKYLAYALLLSLNFILGGCATVRYQKAMDPNAVLNREKGYLYGRFSLQRDLWNQFRLALRLENTANGNPLCIRLVDDRPLYAVEVDPGRYRISDITYAPWGAMMEFEAKKIALPEEPPYLHRAITVEPGKLYYLGDFSGSSKRTGAGLSPVPGGMLFWVTFTGGNVSVEQNFAATTAQLKSLHPQLAGGDFQPAWQPE